MSFRRRLALSTAGAVAVAVVLGSILAYVIVKGTLRGQIDAALRQQVMRFDQRVTVPTDAPPGGVGNTLFLATAGDAPVYTQVTSDAGVVRGRR